MSAAAAASARIGHSATVLHREETGDSDALPRRLTLKRKNYPVNDPLCEKPHAHMSYGACVWEVFSIEVRRNMEYKESEVRIYGEIRLHYDGRFVDYLFKRSREDAQVFKNPGKELSLSLQGPLNPNMLLANLGEFAVYAILKYNDESIFYAGSGTSVEEAYINRQNEGLCFGSYSSITAPRADFCSIDEPITLRNEQFRTVPILNKVASLNLKMGAISLGMVASLKFTASRDLILEGEITAGACNLDDCNIVLFKTEKRPVEVKSNELIPLSRSIAAVHYCSSLSIKAKLFDASNGQSYWGSIHLEDDDDSKLIKDELTTQSFSKTTMFDGLIQVEVKWSVPIYPVYSLGPDAVDKYLIEMGLDFDSDSEMTDM